MQSIVISTITQETQNIYITSIQRRPNVFDVGPTLYRCYTNVSLLLGIDFFLVDLKYTQSAHGTHTYT